MPAFMVLVAREWAMEVMAVRPEAQARFYSNISTLVCDRAADWYVGEGDHETREEGERGKGGKGEGRKGREAYHSTKPTSLRPPRMQRRHPARLTPSQLAQHGADTYVLHDFRVHVRESGQGGAEDVVEQFMIKRVLQPPLVRAGDGRAQRRQYDNVLGVFCEDVAEAGV